MNIVAKYSELVNAVNDFNAVKAKLETAEAEANELKEQANEAELEVKYYESTGQLKTAWADEADQSKAGWTLYHSLDTALVYAGQWEAVSAAVIADQISKQAMDAIDDCLTLQAAFDAKQAQVNTWLDGLSRADLLALTHACPAVFRYVAHDYNLAYSDI